jgi:hypothetical protein
MRVTPCLTLLLVSGLIVVGCSSSTQTSEERSRLFISSAEIEQYGTGIDVYSLVQRLRPMWLRKSGPHSMTGGDDIRVYVDGMRYEAPIALRFYNAQSVESLRFLEPGKATVRYGIGHSHGAIIVNMRGGGYSTP